jgi:broad specificity phosphatase PhoE
VLVRHGETEWSRSLRHTSFSDIALTEAGEKAARALAPALEGRAFALVLTSPRRRARETAALIGFPDAVVDENLVEWNYGEDEGRTTEEIRQERPDWSIWREGPRQGETIAQVAVRAERVIARAVEAAGGGDVLLVAHGHVLRILTARWLGVHPQQGRLYLLGTATRSTLGWEHDYHVIEEWNAITPGQQ